MSALELPAIMDKQKVAEILGVSARQVQRWVADKKLRASRLSHKVLRFRREDVVRFMERNTT